MPLPDYQMTIGFPPASFADRTNQVNLLLLANGLPVTERYAADGLPDVSRGFLESHAEHQRLLTEYRCPADRRIEAFLAEHFGEETGEAGGAAAAGAGADRVAARDSAGIVAAGEWAGVHQRLPDELSRAQRGAS